MAGNYAGVAALQLTEATTSSPDLHPVYNLALSIQGRLLETARKRTRSSSDADDLVQEVLLAASQVNPDKPIPNHTGWVYTVLRHRVANYWRGNKRGVPLTSNNNGDFYVCPDAGRTVYPSDDYGPVRTAQNGEISAIMEQTVSGLTEQGQRVFRHSFEDEMSHAEIADVMGMTIKAVNSSIYRSRKKIRSQIALRTH